MDHARLLIVPGLNDSGPAHWQSWLQAQHPGPRGAVRVEQRDWSDPVLDRWAGRIDATLEATGLPRTPWVAVAHSFGCLALARHLGLAAERGWPSPIRAVLFVAPAEPDKFGVAGWLPAGRLPVPSTVIASDTDPWMTAASSRRWAARWGSHWLTLGDVGHINAESGFGPLPIARRWVAASQARLARERRPLRAAFHEWSFAI